MDKYIFPLVISLTDLFLKILSDVRPTSIVSQTGPFTPESVMQLCNCDGFWFTYSFSLLTEK